MLKANHLGVAMRFSEPMEDLIQVRVARSEKRRLQELARRLGVSLSDLVRERANFDKEAIL